MLPAPVEPVLVTEACLLPSRSLLRPQELTNEWEEAGIIEDAGHSSVSLAKQADGKLLAVKRAKKVSKEGGHMFRNEVRAPPHSRSRPVSLCSAHPCLGFETVNGQW